MRVLICGNRKWDDREAIWTVLEGLLGISIDEFDSLFVIQGGAQGADTIAGEFLSGKQAPHGGRYAEHERVHHEEYPADWNTYGGYAGPMRNQQMLDEGKPDVVWAFSDDIQQSKGTKDMAERAAKAGVPVYVVSRYTTDSTPAT